MSSLHLLQNCTAVCPCKFPRISHCLLKPFPSILEMSWAVQPEQICFASGPVLPKRFQKSTHIPKLLHAADLGGTCHKAWCDQNPAIKKYRKTEIEICKVLSMLPGRWNQGCLQAFLKGHTCRVTHLLLDCGEKEQVLKTSLEVTTSCDDVNWIKAHSGSIRSTILDQVARASHASRHLVVLLLLLSHFWRSLLAWHRHNTGICKWQALHCKSLYRPVMLYVFGIFIHNRHLDVICCNQGFTPTLSAYGLKRSIHHPFLQNQPLSLRELLCDHILSHIAR